MPSSNYSGSAYPAPGNDAPSPSPAPGSTPVIVVPADDTPNTAANLYVSQYKTLADYIAAVQLALRPGAPVALGATVGFSAVTQVGGGAGTVTPGGTSYGGQNVVIKIIAGGATGAATYQYSVDGGTTYSGTATTAGSVSLGATGITVAFAGTFTLGTTYQFKCAFAPMLRLVNQSGKGRFVLDHNGIDTGSRINRVDETYRVIATAASADPWANYGHMRFNRTGATFVYTAGIATPSGFSGPALQIGTGVTNANNDKGYVYQDGATFGRCANSSALISIIEWEAQPSGLAGGNMDIFMGWSGAAPADTAAETMLFRITLGTNTTWQCVTRKSSVSTTVDSLVTAALAWTRFRIEYHDSATPIATALSAANGVALFFINDALVATSSTNLPDASGTGGLRPMFGFKALAANLATGLLDVSPFSTRVVRVADVVI